MPTFINKTVMVFLLCLIFIGQSMASMTMFYSMTAMQLNMQSMTEMTSIKSSNHQSEKMNNTAHDMSAMSDCDEEAMTNTVCSTMSTQECCEQECDCLSGACSTVSAFSIIINYTPVFATPSKINSLNTITTSQTLTSLYRPPILS
ncbi:hypothetical protein [Colwellia sp. Bg11-28]|uniref:hypothetical protein n=1 Tax=Colwellia sp. Bg11-28 TaxID=2058305 RepID=UPI000C34B609|nr:hypothetical protein [Colwellia sp. Bg11-28]PKH85949.1 hypothetical protein CXF79_22275 [Colwellia sp. Bg11-28]